MGQIYWGGGRGLRYVRLLALSTLAIAAPIKASQAAPPPAAVAATVPTDVVEVVTGGSWTEGTANGYFRTVTIEVPSGDKIHAEVFIQWVGTRSVNAPVELIASRAVAEFNDEQHSAASVALETEIDGEVRIEITPGATAADQGEPAQSMTVVATTPAHYRVEASANRAAAH